MLCPFYRLLLLVVLLVYSFENWLGGVSACSPWLLLSLVFGSSMGFFGCACAPLGESFLVCPLGIWLYRFRHVLAVCAQFVSGWLGGLCLFRAMVFWLVCSCVFFGCSRVPAFRFLFWLAWLLVCGCSCGCLCLCYVGFGKVCAVIGLVSFCWFALGCL